MPLPARIALPPAFTLPARRLAGRLAEKRSLLLEPRNAVGVLLTLAVVAALQEYLLGPKWMGDGLYTHYNNFVIYKRSFLHLLGGHDLYARFPAEHWDEFKYSPTFAALMAPFSVMPDVVGLVLWNVLNAAVLAVALARLPVLSPRAKALVCLTLVPDFVTAAQNTQANALLAGLVVLTFDLLEEDRPGWAALPVAAGLFLKLYPALAGVLFLLYPRKPRFLAALAGWVALLGALPLLLVSADHLRELYASWLAQLTTDHTVRAGLSVMAWLDAWFGLSLPKNAVVLAGAAVLLLPAARVAAHERPRFRLLFLSSILVWMVIFNHMAESATFLIAMTGVAIWYFARPRGRRDTVLFALALVFTSMSPRMPEWVIDHVVQPYALKAVPCILVWLAILLELASPEPEDAAASAARPGAGRSAG